MTLTFSALGITLDFAGHKAGVGPLIKQEFELSSSDPYYPLQYNFDLGGFSPIAETYNIPLGPPATGAAPLVQAMASFTSQSAPLASAAASLLDGNLNQSLVAASQHA